MKMKIVYDAVCNGVFDGCKYKSNVVYVLYVCIHRQHIHIDTNMHTRQDF